MDFFSKVIYTATSGQKEFVITFPYLSRTHVFVYKNGALTNDYVYLNDTTIRLNAGCDAGDIITISRKTSHTTRLVEWQSGQQIISEDLNTADAQNFYMSQEAIDSVNSNNLSLNEGTGQYDAQNRKIQNLATPTSPNDATNKSYVDTALATQGYVPTPNNPGDNYKVMYANNGTYSWNNIDTNSMSFASDVKSFLNSADKAEMRASIDLGSAATRNTGTAENTIPLLGTNGTMPAVGLGAMTGLSVWVPIASGSLTGSSIDLTPTGLSDYPMVYMILHGITTADSADRFLYMRWNVNGSWLAATGDYTFAVAMTKVGAGQEDFYNNNSDKMQISIAQRTSSKTILSMGLLITNNSYFLSGRNPSFTALWMQQFHYSLNLWAKLDWCVGGIKSNNAYPVEGIRLFWSAGSFNSGTYYLYGINSMT